MISSDDPIDGAFPPVVVVDVNRQLTRIMVITSDNFFLFFPHDVSGPDCCINKIVSVEFFFFF